MTRKNPLRRAVILSSAAALFCAGVPSALAQSPTASRAHVKPSAKRTGARRMVKIRSRAGDTLSLLGDRFGVTAEEIAALNGIAAGAELKAGSELMIPLPSPELLARTPAESTARQENTVVEAEGAWVNVQGVLFRKGSGASSGERNQAVAVRNSVSGSEAKAIDGQLGKVIEVSEAERSTVAQPVWIYLVGGARVEADSVNETAEGVWYTHGKLTIFIERARIERIERERAVSAVDEQNSWTERGWSTGNPKFDALIRENGARYGVDPYLIFCVMEQESQFKPWVVSPKGARGLMQLMPGTAAHFGVRRPMDPADNIMGGTKYLKQLLESFNGRVDLVLAGYNAGEGAVAKYGGNVPPYRETRDYVKRISKRYGQSRSFVPAMAEAAPQTPGLR
ncbi:MAG TPA: transglycosylase SLT domain-containing protein [Pyrinomonadaceae bacterium]|nr:transglycosylase SLT domain-containing protein [Pyrinomonadaceae bacterium]